MAGRGIAVATLAAGLAGYGLTAAPAASAASGVQCNPGFGGYLGRCTTAEQREEEAKQAAEEQARQHAETCQRFDSIRQGATDADTFFGTLLAEEVGNCPQSFRAQISGS
ncbi:hypothetical protein FCH28_04755 [Streptomyces piniterrae]|uniref:Uncharacterized protein n=1 Tax=Streptomyces piniterrae TaxID=2571125 RepID=A0A4U0NQU2_9ACTN|nr:hypothetical protein [Streptomyces piniterrae]TJZ56833.1 hypothetical protein FCH28_04755 [Streptomyces piniterrae]